MVLFSLLLWLAQYNQQYPQHWIEAGGVCRRDYGPDTHCIHYSNCVNNNYYGIAKGHQELCRVQAGYGIFCCVDNAGREDDCSPESDYDMPPNHPYYPTWTATNKPPYYGWKDPSTSQKTTTLTTTTTTTEQPVYNVPPNPFTSTPRPGVAEYPATMKPQPADNGGQDVEPLIGSGLQDTITSIFGPPGQKPESSGPGMGQNGGDGETQVIEGRDLNVVVPFYRPTFQNSTSMQKCREYFTAVPFVKAPHTPIKNGQPAKAKQFPHMVVLGYGPENDIKWFCGGSLISEQYVLTAAHCLSSNTLGDVRYIRLGEHDLSTTSEDVERQDFSVREAIPHPEYKLGSNYHDIALLRMNASASFSEYIRPACIGASRYFNDTNIFVAAGWGLLEEGGDQANILQKAPLFEVSNERCRKYYGKPRNLKQGILEEIQVCADGGKELRDTCYGDSGGPLQFTNFLYYSEFSGFIEIIGVTSFGRGCGLTAGVYTRVLPYVKWIEGIVWPS